MSKLVDLSHPIVPGLKTYPGLPPPAIETHMGREESTSRYEPGTSFHIGMITMVANTGTYIDAPFHRYADGIDIAQLPLDSIADLPALVVSAQPGERAIGPETFAGHALRGRAVLVHTGWATRWGTDAYFTGHPFLTQAAAELLVEAQVKLVGIDSLNIDSTEGGARPVHGGLLAARVPIVEHLCNLDQLPGSGARFFAVPVKVQGMGSFPVRAFAIVP